MLGKLLTNEEILLSLIITSDSQKQEQLLASLEEDYEIGLAIIGRKEFQLSVEDTNRLLKALKTFTPPK